MIICECFFIAACAVLTEQAWDFSLARNEKGPIRFQRNRPTVAGACNHPNCLVLPF